MIMIRYIGKYKEPTHLSCKRCKKEGPPEESAVAWLGKDYKLPASVTYMFDPSMNDDSEAFDAKISGIFGKHFPEVAI